MVCNMGQAFYSIKEVYLENCYQLFQCKQKSAVETWFNYGHGTTRHYGGVLHRVIIWH